MRIQSSSFDIYQLQNQKKYENQGRINELKIGDKVYTGTEEIVDGITLEMEKELQPFGELQFHDPVTEEEEAFLKLLPKYDWSEEEVAKLNEPMSESEVFKILKYETNLDSSPGEDGLTSRCLLRFWEFPSFRWAHVRYLNFT